jgi:aspartate 1-decarboxylase
LVCILVDKALKFPADVSPKGDRLVPYTGQGDRARDDIVNEAIARVMDTGDEVLSCVSGDLDIHQKIPAGLRY